MEATKEKLTKEQEEKLLLWCESCGETHFRWDMDMVEPSEHFILPDDDFNIACPFCVTEHGLQPVEGETASKFRRINDKLKRNLTTMVYQ